MEDNRKTTGNGESLMGKGKVYEMQYLTDTEKALINAFRRGADINVWIQNETDVNTAIDRVNEFGPVVAFKDFEHHISVTNWDVHSYPNPSVYAHLDKE